MAQQQKQDAYWSKHESKYRVSFARVFSAKGQELSSGRKKNTFSSGRRGAHANSNFYLSVCAVEWSVQTLSQHCRRIMFPLHASDTTNSVYFSFSSRWHSQAVAVEEPTSLSHSCHCVGVVWRWPALCLPVNHVCLSPLNICKLIN